MALDLREPPTIRPKRQPAETVIVWTRFLTAAALVLAAIGFLASEGAVRQELERRVQRDPGLGEDAYYVFLQVDWVLSISFGAVAVVYLCLAVLYATIGVFHRSATARATGWFLARLGLLCCGPVSVLAGLIEFGAGRTLVPQDTGGRDYSAEADQIANVRKAGVRLRTRAIRRDRGRGSARRSRTVGSSSNHGPVSGYEAA
ncbi:hypothetical protein K3N28_01570 [Glycomyces sp. TRM65418]|uniref:hypothetical protein n=1 Tax=Glycomyces sp. TRM65418 TaxID=2867006 RepID=UPI001CE69D4A|nr:hypothetical protein [Glycomyces sp. TRM65418]MCC3761761.1 hypothetical protein [Glycomyces sp. TRM65418]QZD55845.1 hypothetical protein K3N28_01560 [Glycomyces sp. TRM65418]